MDGSAPAIDRAVALLHHLGSHHDPAECTLSALARALGLHKSSTSNILARLLAGGFVEQEGDGRSFRLGPALIGLGVRAAKGRAFPNACLPAMQGLVRATGFTCVAFEHLPTAEFVVVGRVDSPHTIKVTIDIGQHFPPSAPVFARAMLAWLAPLEVEAYLARWGMPRYAPAAQTGRGDILADLARVRREGVSISVGEYYPANTAIAAPVFSASSGAQRGLCLVAFSAEIADGDLPAVAGRVREAALEATRVLGGVPPVAGDLIVQRDLESVAYLSNL